MFNILTLNTPTAIALDAKTIEYIWQTPLIGMAMIFLVLATLWGVLTIFKFIFAQPQKPKAKIEQETVSEPEIVEEVPVEVEEYNDDELVAVITAAVATYISSEDPAMLESGFRVVSFRRTNGGKPWNTK